MSSIATLIPPPLSPPDSNLAPIKPPETIKPAITNYDSVIDTVLPFTGTPSPDISKQYSALTNQQRKKARQELFNNQIPFSLRECLRMIDPASEEGKIFSEVIHEMHDAYPWRDKAAWHDEVLYVLSDSPQPNAFIIDARPRRIVGITKGALDPDSPKFVEYLNTVFVFLRHELNHPAFKQRYGI